MQLSLPLSGLLRVASDSVIFVRHRRARRYILRVRADGRVQVTLPRWGVKREALAFVDANRGWIARQRSLRSRPASPPPWQHGTEILIDGRRVALEVQPGVNGYRVVCGDVVVTERAAGLTDVKSVIHSWLRAAAKRDLPAQLLALAAQHDISVRRVSIRNQQSRWGACSPSGAITLNWRLMQVPPFVREYVLLHELMHRRELNHSHRFWRLVAACCPRYLEARKWLREEGKPLWSESE